jgi:hypothetical protein
MRSLAIPALALSLLSAGCAATPEQRADLAERQARSNGELEAALAGYTPGRGQGCLPPGTPRRTRYFGDTILYEISGNLIYRTDTNGGCNLDRDDILVTRTPMGRSCSGDIVQTIDRAARFPTGACAFGEFVPYRKNRS